MTFLWKLLLSIAFVMQSSADGLSVSTYNHTLLTPTSILHSRGHYGGSAFITLFAIGQENNVPMGLVLQAPPNASMCKIGFDVKEGDIEVADLIAAINLKLTGYEANLENGVIDIIPISPSKNTAHLLDMKLSEFHSLPETHSLIGADLWMFIRAVIAPGQGTVSGGLSSTMAEQVPGIDVREKSVRTILNLIAGEGKGGVWIFRSALVKELTSETPRPYDVYGYGDQAKLSQSISSCSE